MPVTHKIKSPIVTIFEEKSTTLQYSLLTFPRIMKRTMNKSSNVAAPTPRRRPKR